MRVRALVITTAVIWCALGFMLAGSRQRMLVYVIAMHEVQVAVMDIVNMVIVTYSQMSTRGCVRMAVLSMCLTSHLFAPCDGGPVSGFH